jgi:hypothetical protein
MAKIGRLAREAVRAVLAEPVTGFNARFAGVALDYGLQPFSVDWSSASKQVWEAPLDPEDLDATSPARYPLVMLYCVASENRNSRKFATFSGTVEVAVDLHLSWKGGNAPRDADLLADAIEDAVYQIVNEADFQAVAGAPLLWNGDISLRRGPLLMGGEHWLRTLAFRLTFEVDA